MSVSIEGTLTFKRNQHPMFSKTLVEFVTIFHVVFDTIFFLHLNTV